MNRRHQLSGSVFGYPLLLLATAAFAQTPTQEAPIEAQRAALEEVVVTARRREESIQDSPVAVSALTGEDLRERGLANVSDLTKSIPSLQISSPQSNQIYIRGIGERTGFARVDSTVGVYMNGLYLPQTESALLDAVDIVNVQVLRGPQGTLFGKNTTGGAMLIELAKPEEERSGYIETNVGNFGRKEVKGSVSLPLSESLYTRFTLSSRRADGFMEDVSGYNSSETDRQSGIAQLNWRPSDIFEVNSLLFYGRSSEKIPGINCKINNEDALVLNGLYLMFAGDTDPTNPTAWKENCNANSRERLGDYKTNMGGNPPIRKEKESGIFMATADWAISDNLDARLIFGAQQATIKGPYATNDVDSGPKSYLGAYQLADSPRDSYSLEAQLNGSLFDSRVTFSSGVFYMLQQNEEQFASLFGIAGLDSSTLAQLGLGTSGAPVTPTRPTAPGQPYVGIFTGPFTILDFGLEYNTLAAYFQSSWDITERFQLTTGVRYTEEKREANLESIYADADAIGAVIQGIAFDANGAPMTFGPAVQGLHPCQCSWTQDPVSVAFNQFPDTNGDGIPDYPMDYANSTRETRERTFKKWTPSVSASYSLDESSDLAEALSLDAAMIYATWSSGFKSGFFEPRGVDGLQLVEPEEVENREIGLKIDLLQRSIRLNLAAYSMLFTDQQLLQVTVDSSNNLGVIFENAGKSTIEGVELELTWAASANLLFMLNISDNDYRFDEFSDLNTLSVVLNDPKRIDRTHERFAVSPERTVALGIQYRWQTRFGTITPRLDISYKSDIYYGLDAESSLVFDEETELAGQPAFTIADLRVNWENPDGDKTLAFWMRNIGDKLYTIGPIAVAETTGTFSETYGEPRSFGIEYRQIFN